jgi:hypothetical protein
MRRYNLKAQGLAMLGLAATLPLMTFAARAQEGTGFRTPIITQADPAEQGDGTLSPAARQASEQGPLPFSDATAAAKAKADRERDEAEKQALKNALPAVTVAGGFNKPGLNDNIHSPADVTGAIGPTRYIQTVSAKAGIYNRTTGALIGSGTLNQLGGINASAFTQYPQIIWDASTQRFYYLFLASFSASDNRLEFGFSKTADPSNVTTDWCHYAVVGFGSTFPDYPMLGDSEFFTIIGYNGFAPAGTFTGSMLMAISKPAAGTACPAHTTFTAGSAGPLLNTAKNLVFAPVPANQIDTFGTGYAVAVNGPPPADTLWFFNVTKDPKTGSPVFGSARGVTVSPYDIPPSASQPNFSATNPAPVLDTLDTRNTQAVQAIDPSHGGKHAFYTQHTIKSGAASAVRWYEIDPVPATPVRLRSGDIQAANTFFFNAAISPDRRHDGTISQFGDSFVIQFNMSSKVNKIDPSIVAASSFKGAPLSSLLVENGVGPYQDVYCFPPYPLPCRWGYYAGAAPDPRPTVSGRGEVWGTNQFSGVTNPPKAGVSWRTEIFALEP